jgi:type IV pilus assembly protein PilC
MPLFSYRVAKGDGTILQQEAEAENEALLRGRLEGDGYLVLSISKSVALSFPSFSVKKKVSPRDFLIFNHELIVLVKAGLPIMKVLDILSERGSQPDFVKTLKAVQQDVRGGSSIADAMAKHPAVFSMLYVSSLRAGEKSGNLVEVISRFIEYQKKILAVRKKVLAALAYPVFLLTVGMAVLGFLLIYVMPTFAELYQGSKTDLPFFTRILLDFVQFLKRNLVFFVLGLVALVALVWSAVKSGWGKDLVDPLLLKTPFLSNIIKKNYQIRLSRTLSTVLKSGIPLVVALEMVAAAMTSQIIRRQVLEVGSQVRGGIGLAPSFAKVGLFPKMSSEMIAVGETTGSLDEMLSEVANFHEEELDLILSRVTTWVEPILLLTIGTLVALILIAMYLPIFNLAGTIK